MKSKIICLIFVFILLSSCIYSSDVGGALITKGKDKIMKETCKSKGVGPACEAYSALNDPTGKLLGELGPQASLLISGIKDPLGTGKSAAINKIVETLPPESQAAFQFYDKFKGFLSQTDDILGKEEVDRYTTDYKEGIVTVDKDNAPYFVVDPTAYQIKEEESSGVVAAVIGFVTHDTGPPKITFQKITKETSKKPLQMGKYKVLNSKENTEITLKEYKDGRSELFIKNGEGTIEINGKQYSIGANKAGNRFILNKAGNIEFAEFTSKTKNKYEFDYNNIKYEFDITKGGRLKFDPKNNIKASGPLKIKIPKSGTTPDYNYDIKGDYNIIIKNNVPSYIDFKPGGSFCDNLKCNNLKVNSNKAFNVCIGKGSTETICNKGNSLGFYSDEGISTYHSKGDIDYRVKETRIKGKSNSETMLAVGKQGVALNLLNHGNGINFKQVDRIFSIDKKGDMSINVKSFKNKYKTDKNFIVNYRDSNIIMTKKGVCSIFTDKGDSHCIDNGVLNLIGSGETGNKQRTQELVLDRAIEQNNISAEDLNGGGKKLAGFSAWTDCISHFKSSDTCLKEGDKILEYNNALEFVKKQMESGKSYDSSLEEAKKFYPNQYNRIRGSPLHKYLTQAIKPDGSISPTKLNSIIPEYQKQAKCSFLEGCDPGARLALVSIGADNTLFWLNKPVYDAKGKLIGIPNSGIYSELTATNNILYGKNPINYEEKARTIPRGKLLDHISEYPQLGSKKAVLSGVKEVVQVIPPPYSPSGWNDFVKTFENFHKNAKNGGKIPITIDADGNYLFYTDIKDKLEEQKILFDDIKKRNPHLFGLIDKNYKIARSDEILEVYEYVTPLDVATIITPTTALKGLKFAKVLVRTEKGARLSLVGDAFKTLKLGSASRIDAVTELVEARTSLSITDDLIKSGLIRCASPCTLGDIKILLTKANVETNRINEFEKYIKTDKGLDRLRLRNGLGQNLDLVKKSVVNSNDLQDLKSIKAVLEDIKETGFPPNFPNKNALNDIDNLIKEISIKEKTILPSQIKAITSNPDLTVLDKVERLEDISRIAKKEKDIISSHNAENIIKYLNKQYFGENSLAYGDNILKERGYIYKGINERENSIIYYGPRQEIESIDISNLNKLKSDKIRVSIFESKDTPYYATNTFVRPIYPGEDPKNIVDTLTKFGIKAKSGKLDIWEVITIQGEKKKVYLIKRSDLRNYKLVNSLEGLIN